MNGRASGSGGNSRRERGARGVFERRFAAALLASAFAISAGASETSAQPAEEKKEDRAVELKIDPLVISPVALVQVQAVPYVGEEAFFQAGDAAERPGFRLRRARVGFAGELYDVVPFELTAELVSDESATARVHDAWMGYRYADWLNLYAGAHLVPFSRSAMMSSATSALIERPLAVRSMTPFRQVGAHLEGKLWKGALQYYAGVFNGFQRSDQFFSGYLENAATYGNRFDELAYVARLATEPFGDLGNTVADYQGAQSLRFGGGVSYFFSDGGTRNIQGGGADLLLHFKGLHVMGEFLWNQSDPEANPTQATTQIARVKSFAVVGEAGYVLWKKLGISARVEWLDPNTDVASDSDSLVITAGASYLVVEDILKAQLDFTHREELAGAPLKNDLLALQLQLSL